MQQPTVTSISYLVFLWSSLTLSSYPVIVARRRDGHQIQRREQIFTARVNMFGLPESTIFETYRLSSIAILQLLNDLKYDLEPVKQRSVPYLAWKNSLQHCFSLRLDHSSALISAGVSQDRFSSVLSQVLNAMSRSVGRYIDFSKTHDALNATTQRFWYCWLAQHYWSYRLHPCATCSPLRQRDCEQEPQTHAFFKCSSYV